VLLLVSNLNNSKQFLLNNNILEIFAGQLKSTLECSHCQYQSITFDMFWDLSIPLPRVKTKNQNK
jgi:ubiquitin carboxyl-terminal hydrolase 2/21